MHISRAFQTLTKEEDEEQVKELTRKLGETKNLSRAEKQAAASAAAAAAAVTGVNVGRQSMNLEEMESAADRIEAAHQQNVAARAEERREVAERAGLLAMPELSSSVAMNGSLSAAGSFSHSPKSPPGPRMVAPGVPRRVTPKNKEEKRAQDRAALLASILPPRRRNFSSDDDDDDTLQSLVPSASAAPSSQKRELVATVDSGGDNVLFDDL